MNVNLMDQNKNFSDNQSITKEHQTVIRDLNMDGLLDIMSAGDEFLYDICNQGLFLSLSQKEDILYRQDILKDCIKNSAIIRTMYDFISKAMIEKKEQYWSFSSSYSSSRLSGSVGMLKLFTKYLIYLKEIAENEIDKFDSKGFRNFLLMLQKNLDDDFMKSFNDNIKELNFKKGVLLSAQIGKKLYGHHYVLRKQSKQSNWLKWRFAPSFTLDNRDDRGAIDLSKRKIRVCHNITDPLYQAASHVLSFFTLLKTELAFYVGALNLYDWVREESLPCCFPIPAEMVTEALSIDGLYDITLPIYNKGSPLLPTPWTQPIKNY